MKHLSFCILSILGLGLAACSEEKYVLDVYSTMRYDVLRLPTAADTMALQTVDFATTRDGFVGGDNGALFATADGGQTWTRRSSPTTGTIYKLLFTSATAGWAGTGSGLFRTSNGGQTWQYVPTYNVFGSTGDAIYDLQFVTPQVGYAVGSSGSINKTTNGGSTWTPVQFRRDKAYTFRAVSFTSPDSGSVVGANYSHWCTTNGGSTWTWLDQSTGTPNSTIYDVLRFNDQTYLQAGPRGFEAFETSQSYAYTPDERYGFTIYGLASAGRKGPAIAVGQRSIIRRHPEFSTSQHTPWVYVHAPDGTSYKATYIAADFADPTTFYAVGTRGIVHRFHYQ
ncbi:hypothetical protein GCM10023185_35870 [Hymenobacter saemangeumensis]|uniref:Photosynthesis system II assembly factor Ycf48/Hcf136-like domain-containing protein n=1 Tax=Hymenobacter saemangeumensis TaxID=1084522 RepID=A0ABP8IPQ5_9BACT